MSDRFNGPWTMAAIARKYGVDQSRIRYIIASRGFTPVAKAGNIRIFSGPDAERIGDELKAIDARRQGVAS